MPTGILRKNLGETANRRYTIKLTGTSISSIMERQANFKGGT